MDLHNDTIVTIVLGVIAWAITWGIFKNKVSNLEQRMTAAETNGTPYARESVGRLNQQIDYHEKRLTKSEEVYDGFKEIFSEVRSELKLIRAWIESETHRKD